MKGILIGGPDGPRDVSSEEIAKMLGIQPDGFLKEIGKMIGLEDCGDAACPLHGEQEERREDGKIYAGDLESLTAEGAFNMMVGATAAASNAILDKKWDKAAIMQRQADLWNDIHTVLEQQEATAEIRAQEQRLREDSAAFHSAEPKANLGLATTEDLLRELKVRFEVTTPNEPARADVELMLEQLDAATLSYRTADGYAPDGGNLPTSGTGSYPVT